MNHLAPIALAVARGIVLILGIVLAFSSCGGGHGEGRGAAPVPEPKLLVAWTQPPEFEPAGEGELPAPLDLAKDIALYEVCAYDNAATLEKWQSVPFPDNVVRTEFPQVIAYVSGVDSLGVPIQDVAISLAAVPGEMALPDNVFIAVRSIGTNAGVSAFSKGAYPVSPEEGKDEKP